MGVRVNMWGCYFILAISVLGVHGGPVQPGVINGFQENLTYFQERGFELGLSPLWRSECRVWSADEVYLEGDKVQYNGKYYQARWWTSGVAPAAGGTWGDWKLIGDTCNQDDDDNDKPDDNDDDNHDDNDDDHDDSSCDPNTWQGKTWPCGTNGGGWKKYFGRGAKQLSYNFNYGPFSDAMYGTVKKLLENPDLVASTWLNLASATWFYSYPQPPKPSMLHVIDGTWQSNEADKKNKLEPGFGATIMIINGGIECGHGYEKPQATNRQEYYKNFAKFFKLDISGEELSCAHMSKFSKDGAGSLYIYWDREWTKEYQCQLVKYQTPFNALKKGDYVRCVEDQFNVELK